MSGRRAWLTEDGTIMQIRGWGVADELRAAGMKPLYLGTVRAWCLDRKRMSDALAVLEERGYLVQVNVPGPDPIEDSCLEDPVVHNDLVSPEQGTLFDLAGLGGAA